MARRLSAQRAVGVVVVTRHLLWLVIGAILAVAGVSRTTAGATASLLVGGVALMSIAVVALYERFTP